MKLTDVCIDRPVLAWMLMGATVVFGGVAATRIGVSQFPDVDYPTVSIRITWEGAAPEVIEREIVEELEEAVIQVEGVRSITSSAQQGSASIALEFGLERDIDLALHDVQTKVAQAQQRLPRDLDPPIINKTNPEDQPIMWLVLSGAFSEQMLSDIARYRVKEKVQTLPGVGEVILGGTLERNIRVWLDTERLSARDLTVGDVMRALAKEHVELPAGRMETDAREVNIRVMGEALDLESFKKIVIRNVGDAPIHLEDVALVEDGFEDVRRKARSLGAPAQGIGIKKQRGANAVTVSRHVRGILAELQKTLPEGMNLRVNFDSTRFIEDSVNEIQLELALSIALTALVCWLFLGSVSSTLNVVLAIPMSLLGTVATIYFLGFTLNTFTLLGLALAVGIVVDDAIMVLENIFRHSERGSPPIEAASLGTREISFAALAATIAVVAIFIPVVFMSGVVGRFFLQFGVTLCVAVLLSYVEAVTLAPARCAQLLRSGSHVKTRANAITSAFDRGFAALARTYRRVLERGLKAPFTVLALSFVLLAIGFGVVRKLKSEFVPSQDQSRVLIRLQTAVGSSLEETDRLFRRSEDFVNRRPEILRSFAVIGGFGDSGINGGIVFVTLKPPSDRSLTQNEFAAVVRKELNSYPGLRAAVMDLSQSGFSAHRGFPLEFSVRGANWEQLVTTARNTMDKLNESGLVSDLDMDYRLAMPELRIVPDRARAADLGISVEEIATTIHALFGGVRVGKYSTGGRRLDVRMRLLADQRNQPEDLLRLRVRSASGALIPLSAVITQEELPALQSITRKDRERAITIVGNIAPSRAQSDALAFIEKLAKDVPPETRLVLGGASVSFTDSMGELYFALVLGIVVAYMVLASQFNSFLHPITVLSILPLSIAGAVFALGAFGYTLNIFSMIGLLLLMGIVKKNSILLVDCAARLRREGLTAREAMLQAGPIRLRPILMTSIATLMAAIPPALGLGPGSEVRTAMAVAVIGGLIVSTLLSLIVVPAVYVVLDRGSRSSREERPHQILDTMPRVL